MQSAVPGFMGIYFVNQKLEFRVSHERAVVGFRSKVVHALNS